MLIVEQEAHNLPPFGVQYVARDNPCGVALELLLYGDTGNPTPTPSPTPDPTPTPPPTLTLSVPLSLPPPLRGHRRVLRPLTPLCARAHRARAAGARLYLPISRLHLPYISPISPLYLPERTGLELQVLAAMHMQSFARGWLTRQRAKMASAAKIVQRRFRQDAKFRASPEGRAAKKKRRRPPAPYRAAITIQRRARAMLWARKQAARP